MTPPDSTPDSSATPEQVVTLAVTDAVATVTIDAPARRNALGREVQAQLLDAIGAAERDDAVRAIVVTGSGEKVFAAGADLSQLGAYTAVDGVDGPLQAVMERIDATTKPTVAAVNGWALGGGCELALACDVRVASTRARFGFPETGVGVMPAAGGTQRLTRAIGQSRAMDMILTGRFVDAELALSYGLVTYVAEPAELLSKAHEVAATIAGRAPLATRLARIAVRSALDTDLRTGQALERVSQAVLHTTADKQEGISAFLEKRSPGFSGR